MVPAISPSVAPVQDGIVFSVDPSYALDGKIMVICVVGGFVILMICFAICSCRARH